MCDVCVTCVWRVCGVCVACVWRVCGVCGMRGVCCVWCLCVKGVRVHVHNVVSMVCGVCTHTSYTLFDSTGASWPRAPQVSSPWFPRYFFFRGVLDNLLNTKH